MKYMAIALTCLLGWATQASGQTGPKLATQKDSVSYIIGTEIAKNLQKQDIDIDPGILAKGFSDEYTGAKLLLTEEQIEKVMAAFQQQMISKEAERMAEIGERNKKQGEAFLAENKKKDSVKTLPSGLQYKVLVQGTGRKPTLTDTVTTHYRGTLIDGTEFDSSYKRGEPASFPVGGVIRGWTEALQLMNVGSKWELFIPSDLAYGERGAGQTIGPNSTLIFEVELLSIK
ncbi:MAG TPA: FKBP-type peptidyl-prolyl cis-trans isomerase [Bacteroidota bacterium]|nr:FKBP-type peptidyl-prolyl cis-trans isomerase [Bacteroidota bacterium]